MKLQNLTVIFIIIILPIILITSLYITTGLKTIELQARYDTGLIDATFDAISAFEKNTANIQLSGNPEIKRSIINASIKMFEKSLCNTCNISSYNTNEIEQYIPAIVFGMYDGFYIYAPSGEKGEYKHNLKNYVYYSETLEGIGQDDTDIVIMYSLDNYVTVYGDFEGDSEGYITKSGYLTIYPENYDDSDLTPGSKYKDVTIKSEKIDGTTNTDAMKYYWESFIFTEWFNKYIGENVDYLEIVDENDPENENSPFVQHKRTVIKNKIEGVLNSTITAYSNKTFGQTYKMPKLTEEDWEKTYSNISMLTFFQGKKIGFTQYNGYCVLNSTNNNEYVNPNLMYFIDGEDDTNHYYHDIRCTQCKNATELTGYKTGAFKIRKSVNEDGTEKYVYDHQALACYECINAPFSTNKSVYEYIWGLGNTTKEQKIKSAYWTSLARERYNSKRVNAATIRVTSKDGIRIGYYNNIRTALAECPNGGTIEILEELVLTDRLGIGSEKDKIRAEDKRTNVTITGKITTTDDIYIFEGATVKMNNVTINRISGSKKNAMNVINNNGILTINNSTIIKHDDRVREDEYGIENHETVIRNRSVLPTEPELNSTPRITINNSKIENKVNKSSIINNRGIITINYSNIINASGEKVITTGDECELTINTNEDINEEMIWNTGGKLTINGNSLN